MMRTVNSTRLMRGNLVYQVAIGSLLFLLVSYAIWAEMRHSRLLEQIGGEPPVGSAHRLLAAAKSAPPVVCNCHCDGKLTSTVRGGSSAMVPRGADAEGCPAPPSCPACDAPASTPAVGAGSWSPITSQQSYSSLPRVRSDLADDKGSSHMQFVRATYPPVGPEKGSILEPSYLDTPIAYGTALVPASDDDNMPTGFTPRPACQADTDLVQNYIYANQHPSDCKTARLFVRRHLPSYGLFAGLGHGSNYIFLAALLGRALIDLSPNSYFTGNCASNNLECAFLPLSNCTEADFREEDVCYDASCFETARVISVDKLGKSDHMPCAPREFPVGWCNRDGGPQVTRSLKQILPELGNHGEQFLQNQFSRYMTRPNKALAEFTAKQMALLGLDDQMIGVHIRHGDKQEGIQFPTRAYGLVVRRVVQVTGIKTVFIGSDDKSVYAELPKWVDLADVQYKYMDPDANPIVFSAAEAARKGAHTIGLYLMAQTIIMTQAQAYIGTRSSNAGQIVYAMQGNDCSRQKIAYDMYGDLFYNSWYCRGDIEHAGREWMCALQKPAEGSLIWQWGGAKTEC